MASNIRPHGGTPPDPPCPAEDSATRPGKLSAAVCEHLLVVFRRLSVVLELTADTARTAGKLEHHAALNARLAVFRARIEAGDRSARLGVALADFGEEFKTFHAELGYRGVRCTPRRAGHDGAEGSDA